MVAAKRAGATIRVAGDWATFVQDLVSTPPDACLLLESTLSQRGAAGLQAAEALLNALELRTVIALETDDPSVRFTIEMETDFAYFVLAPFTEEKIRVAVNSTRPDAPPLLDAIVEPSPPAQARVPAEGHSSGSGAQRMIRSEEPSSTPASTFRRGAGHSVTDIKQRVPSNPTVEHTPAAASDIPSFFGSDDAGAEHSPEINSRVTAPNEIVPQHLVREHPSGALPSLEEFGPHDALTASGPEPARWTRESITKVGTPHLERERALASTRPEDAIFHASAAESEADALDFSGFGDAEQREASQDDARAPREREDASSEDMMLRDLSEMLPELDLLPEELGAAAALAEPAASGSGDRRAVASAPSASRPAFDAPKGTREPAPPRRALAPEFKGTDDEPIAPPDESSASARYRSVSASSSGAALRASRSGAWRPSSSSQASSIPTPPSTSGTGSGVGRAASGAADAHRGGQSTSGEARAVSGASGRGAISTLTSGELFTINLPDPNAGSIDAVSVPQIVYALSVARATGELTLTTASLARKVIFFHGEPGTVFETPTADDERKFLSTFGWSTGTYAFEAKEVPEAQFFTFGEPIEFIYRGVQRHFGVNETATALGPYLKQYIVSTDQASRFRRVLGLEGLSAFTRNADGNKTLEQMMGAGADTEALLRHAYFAWLTGAIVCTDQPMATPLAVQLEVPEIGAKSQERVEKKRRTITLQPEREAPAPPVAKAAAPATNDAHQQTFERLGNQWDIISSRGPYEVFELEAGCGPDEVNRRFYELVREYHPDRYARTQNAQVRTLAEKVFVQIRNLHTELLALERGRAAAASEQDDLSASGAQRRRRRSVRGRVPSGWEGRRPESGLQTPLEESVSGSDFTSGEPRKVSDVLSKLRARGVSGDHASPVIAPSVRKLNPDQLVRNAKFATEQGNFEKAAELVELAMARGASGEVVEAYAAFLSYTLDRSLARAVIQQLEELTERIPEDKKIALSQVLTLAGHTSRLEEDNKAAVGFYQQATRTWSDNESATRWLRHLNRRQADDKKKPFSSTLLNKLFTPKSK